MVCSLSYHVEGAQVQPTTFLLGWEECGSGAKVTPARCILLVCMGVSYTYSDIES